MANQTIEKIKGWLEFRTFTRDRFVKEYNISAEAIHEERTMYQLKKLTFVHDPSVIKAQFFFHPSGDLAIIRVYQELLEQLSIKDIEKNYGEPESVERSSAGKRAHYNIYAKEGFAYSSLDDEIHFMDVFPSTSTEEYIGKIYQAPGPFIR